MWRALKHTTVARAGATSVKHGSPSVRRVPTLTIDREDPRDAEVRRLLEAHHVFAHAHSPPEDVHALDVDGLLDPAVTFLGGRADGVLLAVGALKRLDDDHAELKSMHVLAGARGHGLGRAMVEHLLAVARAAGVTRVSLETGSMDAFRPARVLYAGAGFEPCGPFADYRESPHSAFMTLALG